MQTSEECYGHEVSLTCADDDELVQIVHAYYRQAAYCRGDFHSVFCSREELSSPPCVGRQRCRFSAPWHYISRECGYSNAFMVAYKCVHRKYMTSRRWLQ